MVNVTKLGHAEFGVRDLARMSDFYQEVLGLTETGREAGVVYLSTAVDHHSLVLRKSDKTGLTKIAFQVAPINSSDIVSDLRKHGLSAEIRTDSQPGMPDVVRTRDTDGVAIELYSAFEPFTHHYSYRGINPLKLSHIASLSPELHRLVSFYTDVLGFRFSDSMQDFFYFLRCGCDHHTINMAAGQYSAVQHFAFELTDVAHMRSACDVLARHGVEILWGPLRHGCGHNLAFYHFDPEGLIIEHCAELDRMSNESLGYFDPRPYHEDRPQRPKQWDPKAAISVWGRFPPPELFNTGLSDAARGMTTEGGRP
jgi:catechol 2,3-dioxygenase-like lactoylglutathione lyase family enzyme